MSTFYQVLCRIILTFSVATIVLTLPV